MKKYLTLVVIALLAIAPLANAANVYLIGPSGSVSSGDSVRVYLGVDQSGLFTLSASISATNATITGGITAAESVNYGAQYTDYTGAAVKAGGWQSDLSFNTAVVGGVANIGLGHSGSTIYGVTSNPLVVPPVAGGFAGMFGATANAPIAYIDLIAGVGNIVLSITNGSTLGSTSLMDDLSTVPTFTGTTITVIPEPITVALMGLGGLFVARKKK